MITGTITSKGDGQPLPGVNVMLKGTSVGVVSDVNGKYQINITSNEDVLVFSFIGFLHQEVKVENRSVINVAMESDVQSLNEVVVTGYGIQKQGRMKNSAIMMDQALGNPQMVYEPEYQPAYNTEEYDAIHENIFLESVKNPLSTFSVDVDAASYSNIRRFISQGQMPPKDAVRIEEMVNYFTYDYPQPTNSNPFSVTTEISSCPWNTHHQLVHIGLQGREIPTDDLPPSNLVFLIDVSGSMVDPNKLPLLKAGFRMLVNQLRPQDRVAIVVYAGAAGLVLPSTAGDEKAKILRALDQLQAGGSTAGGAGIQLAYQTAKVHFVSEGNNRVILATDGDFNTGVSSNAEMERLIEEKRKEGVFLTVLGFGTGNYKDSKMETLADKGNGNYAYIDNLSEAKKVLVSEFGGTLFTIAKDVKLQIEFNPAKVKAYRLLGYENRALKNEDFNNDKKDAGEIGSGHTVTALYEIIPAGGNNSTDAINPIDDLKYQQQKVNASAAKSKELFTLKIRYKTPEGDQSRLLEQAVIDAYTPMDKTSDNFRFSAAVAGFGMMLRDSEFKNDFTYADVIQLAKAARGKDVNGYRLELIRMVESCNLLAEK